MIIKLLRILPVLAFCLVLNSELKAQGQGVGLGVIVGEPTGLSFKAWVGGNTAIAAAAAWSFEGRGFLHLHLDYLRHASLSGVNKGAFAFYYGLGARVQIREDNGGRFDADDDLNLGVRIPLGLTYIFSGAPLDIFLEIAPVVELIPSTDADIDGGLGLRFYF